MNFKLINFLFILALLYGCGVKARPNTPPETAVNSYIESYTGTPVERTPPPAQTIKK